MLVFLCQAPGVYLLGELCQGMVSVKDFRVALILLSASCLGLRHRLCRPHLLVGIAVPITA